MKQLKEGDILIAIDECLMENGVKSLTIGREYSIDYFYDKRRIEIVIIDDQGDDHLFPVDELNNFFKLKEQ